MLDLDSEIASAIVADMIKTQNFVIDYTVTIHIYVCVWIYLCI